MVGWVRRRRPGDSPTTGVAVRSSAYVVAAFLTVAAVHMLEGIYSPRTRLMIPMGGEYMVRVQSALMGMFLVMLLVVPVAATLRIPTLRAPIAGTWGRAKRPLGMYVLVTVLWFLAGIALTTQNYAPSSYVEVRVGLLAVFLVAFVWYARLVLGDC